MSKGKRKSDPRALQFVLQRLRGSNGQPTFTEADRDILTALCRTDLIHLIEIDLAMGPLKSSQKNSVGTMVNWLLSQNSEEDAVRAELPSKNQQDQPAPMRLAASDDLCPDSQQDLMSSQDASCHTPDLDLDVLPDDQADPTAAAIAAAEPTADVEHHPWLEELQQQLAAAAAAARDQSTDTEGETDTDAESQWTRANSGMLMPVQQRGMQQQVVQQPQQPQLQLPQQQSQTPQQMDCAAAWNDASNVDQVEQMLLQQLLLDIKSKPQKHQIMDRLQQPQQQQLSLQQQQQQLPRLPVSHLPLPQQLLLQQQQQQQSKVELDFEQLMHQELLEQQQQQQHQELLMQADVAPAVHPGPGANLSWPLPCSRAAIGDADPWADAAAAAVGRSNALSMPMTPVLQQPQESGGSFIKKRERRSTVTNMQRPPLFGLAPAADPQYHHEPMVEASGPSADLPTKRMSVTLPGSNEIGSLPTSFSGRMASGSAAGGAGALWSRPGLIELESMLGDSSFTEPAASSMQWRQAWQQQLPHQQEEDEDDDDDDEQQHQQDEQDSAVSGLAHKLRTLLRGKSKARRYRAGSAATADATAWCSSMASAGELMGVHAPSAAAAALHTAAASLRQSSTATDTGLLLPSVTLSHAAGSFASSAAAVAVPPRAWDSVIECPRGRTDSTDYQHAGIPAAVGGLSWHADPTTGMPSKPPVQRRSQHRLAPPAASAEAAAPQSHHNLAQQLAHLRALYGHCDADTGFLAAAEADAVGSAAAPSAQHVKLEPGFVKMEPDADFVTMTPAPAVAGVTGTKPGFVKKLVRAFKLSGHNRFAPDAGTLEGVEDEQTSDDLLITARCDGEMDLARAVLNWQQG